MAQTDSTLYDTIENVLRSHTAYVPLSAGTSAADVRTAIRHIMRHNPDIFWFSHQYYFDEKAATLCLSFNFTREKRDFYERQIAAVVSDNFQPNLLGGFSDLKKVAYVYQWIVANTTYNEYSSFNQTIYSVLINRNSVCTGYAKTAQYLLGILDIESRLVFGKLHADRTPHGRHCWNIVKIDGTWYHVDFCLADPSLKYLLNPSEAPSEAGGVLWNYFGKPTSAILQNRMIENQEDYPECSNGITQPCVCEIEYPAQEIVGCKSDSGATSRVYLNAYDKHSVVKIPRGGNRGLLQNEIEAMEKLSGCRHCVQLRGICDEGIEIEQLTPWSELLNSHYYKPTEAQLRQILTQLAEGVLEIKAKGLVYPDIHYNNIFVTSDGVYKWGDFGHTFSAAPDNRLPDSMVSEAGMPYGSGWFMAPETYRDRIYTEASAVYSLAMLAYFVMNGMRPPFWPESGDSYLNFIGLQPELPRYGSSYGLLPELICRFGLAPSVENRISTLRNFIDILSGPDNVIRMMLTYNISDTDYFKQKNNCGVDSYNVCPGKPAKSVASPRPIGDYPVDTDTFACTAAFPGIGGVCVGKETFSPSASKGTPSKSGSGRLGNVLGALFGGKTKVEEINACVYAPAAIRPREPFIVRVYMYRPDETQSVTDKVKDIDPSAVRKEYKPLDLPVKNGDKLTVSLSFSGNVQCDIPIKTVVWRGRFTDCSFSVLLLDESQRTVAGTASVLVNGIPAGEMLFTIQVSRPQAAMTYAKVEVQSISKVFISYAHADVSQVRGIAEGCRMLGKDYFFDRHSLNAGDIFKDKILQYIDDADLFVLCWSKNAAQSEWVNLERIHALRRIDSGDSNLRIYPLSIAPEAPLPDDMSERYNFGRYDG